MRNLKFENFTEQLRKELSKHFNTNIAMGYIDNNQWFDVYIHFNKYDYKKIRLNYTENLGIEDYIKEIRYALVNNRYQTYIAPAEERYLEELIEQNNVQDLFILHDGVLYADGYEICIEDIEYISYDKINKLLEIVANGEKFKINFNNENVEFINSI